jgi:hypothetical protein
MGERKGDGGDGHTIYGERREKVTEIKTDRLCPETITNECRLYRKPRSTMDCSA